MADNAPMHSTSGEVTLPEERWPTPNQWRDAFINAKPERQLAMAEKVIRNSQVADDCFIFNHKDRTRRLESLLQIATAKLSRYEVVSDEPPPLEPYDQGYEDAFEGRDPRLLSKFATDVSAYIKGYDKGKAEREEVGRLGSSNA